jgi:hypothetical protein
MNKRIGLIAGSGQFPVLFARIASSKGWHVVAAGYQDETDPELAEHVEVLEWFYLGQIKRLVKFFQNLNVEQAVMMGAITKTRMFTNVRPDMAAISLFAGMRHTHDDALLRTFADYLEKQGVHIKSSTFLMPELLAPYGTWTRRQCSHEEIKDIRIGWKIAKAVGSLDIGQCVVVGGGSILAVEAMEGTDETIRRGGSLAKGHAIVVKVCKPIQDTRFDVPAVGLGTIETMRETKVAVLAIEAGKAIVFDRDAMITKADQYGLTIIALKDEELELET